MTTKRTTIRAEGLWSVLKLVDFSVRHFTPFWQRFERRLPELQRDWADQRWGGAIQLATETVDARRARKDYYRLPRARGVTAEGPPAVHTGLFVEATSKLLRRTRNFRTAEPTRVYRNGEGDNTGPQLDRYIRGKGGRLYDVRSLNRAVGEGLDHHARSVVLSIGSTA